MSQAQLKQLKSLLNRVQTKSHGGMSQYTGGALSGGMSQYTGGALSGGVKTGGRYAKGVSKNVPVLAEWRAYLNAFRAKHPSMPYRSAQKAAAAQWHAGK